MDKTESTEMNCGFDLIAHLHRQRDFSSRTFGPGTRTKGVIAHIRKELVEIERKPSDLFEWIDVVLLALDGAWRAGYDPGEIASALEAKQAKNEKRDWPDWRTASEDGPIEHTRGGWRRHLNDHLQAFLQRLQGEYDHQGD